MGRSYRYITFNDRAVIQELYESGGRPEEIAGRIGVHVATIYRELQRGFTGACDEYGHPVYDPLLAQKKLQDSLRRKGRRHTEADSA